MIELWLNFIDEKGELKRLLVEQEKFVIGRHSENDLSVANGKLSREHIKIERFGDVCVVSDCGSSNGTTLNGTDLTEPVVLKDGDKLNLGGGLEIKIELVSDNPNAANPSAGGGGDSAEDEAKNDSQTSSASAGAKNISASSSGSSIPTSFFYLAPLFGVVILLLAGGIFFAFRGKGETDIVKNNSGFYYGSDTNDEIDSPKPGNGKTTETPDTKPSVVSNNGFATPTPDSTNTQQPTPQISGEKEKVKQTAALFLRRVAINDPNAFLTNKQTDILSPKINQLKDSTALADNLKSAKRDSARIAEIARGKNLKPEFLVTAALAKLGNQRGNVAETAESMSGILTNLSLQIGNESANDCPLILSAFEQGEANDFMKMRNMLQSLANQFPGVSSNTIRSIWFLKENQKISDAQFELAVRFLAVGTIMQNPKDFGVNADAIIF